MKYSTYSLLFPALATAVGVNPDPTFNPATSKGDLGPFVPVKVPGPGATGAPSTVSAATAKALQAACDAWSADTGKVSNFLNIGAATPAGQQFNSAANVGFLAEVDELTHKAVLDMTIGADPQVSISNLTLTNGCFQSVVNNLQIMSVQGKNTQALINSINQVRCTQVLPSIDTYMLVAAKIIGPGAILRQSIKPAACAGIVAANANNPAAFPNVPNAPGGTPLGQQAPVGAAAPAAGTGATGTTGTAGTAKGGKGAKGGASAAVGTVASSSAVAAAVPIASSAAVASPSAAAGAGTATTGTTKGGKGTKGGAAAAPVASSTVAAPIASSSVAGIAPPVGAASTGTASTTGGKGARKGKKAANKRRVAFYA